MSGSCGECSRKDRLQIKLQVSERGDVYEREADRVADQAMSAGLSPHIQRFPEQSTAPTEAIPAASIKKIEGRAVY
jgi:hypothetical protein